MVVPSSSQALPSSGPWRLPGAQAASHAPPAVCGLPASPGRSLCGHPGPLPGTGLLRARVSAPAPCRRLGLWCPGGSRGLWGSRSASPSPQSSCCASPCGSEAPRSRRAPRQWEAPRGGVLSSFTALRRGFRPHSRPASLFLLLCPVTGRLFVPSLESEVFCQRSVDALC